MLDSAKPKFTVQHAESAKTGYLSSTKLSAEMFGQAVRAHWRIENRLHRMLDLVFREDLAQLRRANAPENISIVRHTALNLLSKAKLPTSFENRRKKAG